MIIQNELQRILFCTLNSYKNIYLAFSGKNKIQGRLLEKYECL